MLPKQEKATEPEEDPEAAGEEASAKNESKEKSQDKITATKPASPENGSDSTDAASAKEEVELQGGKAESDKPSAATDKAADESNAEPINEDRIVAGVKADVSLEKASDPPPKPEEATTAPIADSGKQANGEQKSGEEYHRSSYRMPCMTRGPFSVISVSTCQARQRV